MKVSGAPKVSSGASARKSAPRPRSSGGSAAGGGMASAISALKSASAGKGSKVNVSA